MYSSFLGGNQIALGATLSQPLNQETHEQAGVVIFDDHIRVQTDFRGTYFDALYLNWYCAAPLQPSPVANQSQVNTLADPQYWVVHDGLCCREGATVCTGWDDKSWSAGNLVQTSPDDRFHMAIDDAKQAHPEAYQGASTEDVVVMWWTTPTSAYKTRLFFLLRAFMWCAVGFVLFPIVAYLLKGCCGANSGRYSREERRPLMGIYE